MLRPIALGWLQGNAGHFRRLSKWSGPVCKRSLSVAPDDPVARVHPRDQLPYRTHLNPMWLVLVSSVTGVRAAGR